MSTPDTKSYPLTRASLQPHPKKVGLPTFEEMLQEYSSYYNIRSLGLPATKIVSLLPTLTIEFPASVTKEDFLLALEAHNRYIFAEQAQALDHDHEICPIDHVFCSKQGEFTFDVDVCIAGVIYPSEGNPHALFVQDILLSDRSFNQPYKGNDLLALNKELYEKVWLPVAKLLGGTFVLTSDV